MVHRPHRLIEIITALTKYKLEPKRMKMVHPFVEKDANMVLIEAVRGGKSMIKVEAPIVVYQSRGVYTQDLATFMGIENDLWYLIMVVRRTGLIPKRQSCLFLPLLSVNSIFSFQFWIKIMNFGIGVRIMNAYN